MKMRARTGGFGVRNRATIYRGSPGERIKPKPQGTPIDETHLECPNCHAGVLVRLDGTLYSHAIGGGNCRFPGIPCTGSGMLPVGAKVA